MRVMTIAILIAAAALAGCSSFKLGAVLYCPHGEACSFQKFPAPQPEKTADEPKA